MPLNDAETALKESQEERHGHERKTSILSACCPLIPLFAVIQGFKGGTLPVVEDAP